MRLDAKQVLRSRGAMWVPSIGTRVSSLVPRTFCFAKKKTQLKRQRTSHNVKIKERIGENLEK